MMRVYFLLIFVMVIKLVDAIGEHQIAKQLHEAKRLPCEQ